jgi:thiopurine S-methyltransferase
MHPDFWHERWQKRQIGFHRSDTHPYLQRFWSGLGTPAAARVLVPLCGKSRDMLWLRAQGHEVLGVELSELAVREFFEEHGLQPAVADAGAFRRFSADGVSVLCGDIFALTAEDLADIGAVYDRAALVALPPGMRFRYAEHLLHSLPEHARTMLISFAYPQHEMDGPPFSVEDEEIARLFGARCSVRRLHTQDILAQEPRFRDKGVTRMHETVFALERLR